MLFVPARKGVIFSGCFQHLSLSLVFRSLITTCLGMDFSEMILLNLQVSVSSQMWELFSHYWSAQPHLLLFFSRPLTTQMPDDLWLQSHRTPRLVRSCTRDFLFSLCWSVWIISLVLASSLLIFFPLSFPPCCWAYSKAFISVIPFFSSKICIYFSFISSIFLFRACS